MSVTSTYLGQLFLGYPVDVTACYPSGYGAGFASSGYYSPGACPQGYVTGCMSINSQVGVEVLCCLYGFSCRPSRIGPSTTGLDDVLASGVCGSTFAPSASMASIFARYTGVSNPTRLLAWGIRIRPEVPNTQAPTTVTKTAAPGASIPASVPQITGSAPTSGPSPPSQPAGLATGAKIGIGAALFVVLCVIAVLWIHLRRRRQSARTGSTGVKALAELDAESPVAPRQELAATGGPVYHELDSGQTGTEMDAEPVIARAELGSGGKC